MPETDKRRAWVITATWFGTIALLGLLKRVLDRQRAGDHKSRPPL